MNLVVIAAILAMVWFERGKAPSMRPSYIGVALLTMTTALAYWIERGSFKGAVGLRAARRRR